MTDVTMVGDTAASPDDSAEKQECPVKPGLKVKTEPGTEAEAGEAAAPGDDGSDPVVKSYELHLANRLFQHLHLFQFPCRPADRPYNFEKLSSMKMQVRSNRFELEFDPKHKSRTTLSFDGEQPDEERAPHEKNFVLSSTKIRNKTNYAIGVVRAGMMHITGLPNMHQFRPDLEKTMAANRAKDDDMSSPLAAAPPEEERLTKQEQARLEAMQKYYEGRLRSFALAEQRTESWVSMGLSTSNNPESKRGILERLFSSSNTDVPLNPRHTTELYLNQLFKSVHERWLHEPFAKIPLSMTGEFDWRKQVDSIMMNAKVLRFSDLRKVLRPHKASPLPADKELLQYIVSCCVIIKGMLVVKCTPDLSPSSAAAREWILYKMWEATDSGLRRADLTPFPSYKFEVDPLWMRQLLEGVAVMVDHEDPQQRMWVLRNGGCDPGFVQSFPDIVAAEDRAWGNERKAVIERNIFRTPQTLKEFAFAWRPQPVMVAAPTQTKAHALRQAEQAIDQWIQTVFRKIPVWNKQVLDTRFREVQRKHAAKMTLPDEVYVKCLKRLTRPFNDGIILTRLSPGQEVLESDQYRDIVIELFMKKAAWNKSEFDSEVGHIPKAHIIKILQELSTLNGTIISAKPGHR